MVDEPLSTMQINRVTIYLIRPFTRMTSHVIPHFTQLHAGVVTNTTFVGFLVSMSVSNVSNKFTCENQHKLNGPHLIRALASVAPQVALQFTQLHTSVLAVVTSMRFLECVSIPNMSYKFTCGRHQSVHSFHTGTTGPYIQPLKYYKLETTCNYDLHTSIN